MGLLSNAQANHKSICIIYATESGNTKNYAEQASALIGRSCHVTLINANVFYADAIAPCESTLQKSELVILMTSTFGSGDPPQVRSY